LEELKTCSDMEESAVEIIYQELVHI
jgi:hypothetical protein